MQARLILLLRPVIIWIAQAAVTAVSFWVIDKIFDKMLEEIKVHYGLSDDDARIVIANNLLEAATFIGVGSATVASKIPIKLAKKLGFADAKVVKRLLSKEATAKIIAKDGAGAAAKITGAVTTAETAEFVAATRGISLAKVKSVLGIIATVVGVPTGFFFAFAQYIDFANWQGPYQHFFQRMLDKIGIHPDTPMPKANVVSADVWKRIYSTIEELEPVGISYPFSGVDKPYSRLNLADLIDEVAANMAKNGTSTSYKNVLGVALPLIQLKNKERTDADIDAIFDKISTVKTTSTQSVSSPTTTKVFTGIISQGVVGAGLSFTARPDDLIESAQELREAAANNLAPFLSSLLGKIVYEVKVVSSVITKDGFKQTGTTQRIKNGTDAQGNPKYRTVTNKFATLIVYAITDKGTRAKLTTIILGPVNSAKLTIGQNDLRTLETQLPADITTTSIKDIKGIETAESITISTPTVETQVPAKVTTKGWYVVFTINGIGYQIGPYTDDNDAFLKSIEIDKKYRLQGMEVPRFDILEGDQGLQSYESVTQNTNEVDTSAPAQVQDKNTNGTMQVEKSDVQGGREIIYYPPGMTPNASLRLEPATLYEWYQINGQSLPSISVRAKKYTELGLGQASFYTGTAEQNTKLLNALKGK